MRSLPAPAELLVVEHVVAGAAVDPVGPRPRRPARSLPEPARRSVRAAAAEQQVGPAAAGELVVAGLAADLVVAGAAADLVVAAAGCR